MKLNLFVSFYILLITINFISSASWILNYHYFGEIYSIEEDNNNYKVVIKEVVYCFKAPCNQPIVDQVSINNKEDIDNLKIVFDEIFKDTEYKEKDIYPEELTVKQKEIINNVLQRNVFYTIINGLDQYNKDYEKRGYYKDLDENNTVFITIAMGEKPSGGYSIGVEKIEMDDNKVTTIYVNEKKPGNDVIVTDALTYPVVQIKFRTSPSEVTVLNYETGEKFPLLQDSFIRISGASFNMGHFLLLLIFFLFQLL